MAQQQAPAVGTVMDGYRFKGGDPAQESSWEQVEPIDVSAQYGAGARQLPNGVIERVGPRGGVQRVGSANGGAGGGASALVGADARARFMINFGPLQEAQANLERLDQAGYDPSSIRNGGAAALEAIPFDGGFAARAVGGADYNAYTQAAKTFEAAIMPIMSGAAVTPSEAQRLIRAALPQPGDSPEVLAQKSAQRRQMINAVAGGIGEPAPYANPQFGPLPDVAENGVIDSAPIVERNGQFYHQIGLAPGTVVPGSERISTEGRQLTADEMQSLGYIPDAETGTWLAPINMTPGDGGSDGGSGSGDGAGGPSGSRDGAAAQRTADGEGLFRKIDAAVRGAADFWTAGAADEIAGYANTVLPLDRGSRAFWQDGQSWESALAHNIDMQRGIDAADQRDVPVSRAAGQVGAAVVTLPRAAPAIARGLGSNVVRGAGAGAAYGGAYGFGSGEGNALERVDDAGMGAVGGAAAGAAAPVAARYLARPVANALTGASQFGGRLVGRGGEMLGIPGATRFREALTPNALDSGIEMFASRSPQQVNALQDTVSGFRAQGIEPTFADAINDGGRGTLRALGGRQTPARDAAREFAEGRAEAFPSRLSVQSRRIVSPDARPVDDIVSDLRTSRASQARTDYAEPYAQPIRIDAETAAALSGAPGRAAIQRARAAAEAFQDAGSVAELDALAAGQTQEVSAATLDRIRQAMSGRAEQLSRNPGTRAVGAGVGQRAGQVDQALDNVEGLAPAREAYRQSSRQIDATEMGGRFMQAAPDEFVSAVEGLSPEQLAPVRSAIARNIEISARTPGGAPGVARRLYADPETRRMAEAALGQDAGRLADAARAEARVVRNAADINPRSGSQTSLNQRDALGAAGELAGAARDVGTGNIAGLAGRAMNSIRRFGFSNQQAESIVTAAIDPNRTDELIGVLAERMSRREARNLARAIRYQVTIALQSSRQE